MKRVITPIPVSFAQKGRGWLLTRIDGLYDRGDWKANGTAKSQQRNRGLVRGEIGYEAHAIGGKIRTTRPGIEGSGNARRRRAEEPLAQPLWHEAPSEDPPLSPDRSGCPPNAGEWTGRTQIFGPPPSNASRTQPGDPTNLTALPEPTS